MNSNCIVCGNSFNKRIPSQKFCSKKCNGIGTRTIKERNCHTCGKVYRPSENSSIYCSTKCLYNYKGKIAKLIKCRFCKKSFKVKCSRELNKEFCSWKCRSNFLREKRKGFCLQCQQEFYKPKSNSKYCSNYCKFLGMNTNYTKIEIELYDFLSKNKIEFTKQYDLKFTIPDAFIPELNLCVYADGIYWHSPNVNKGRDRRQGKKLKSLGFKVLRLKEQKDRSLDMTPLVSFLERKI